MRVAWSGRSGGNPCKLDHDGRTSADLPTTVSPQLSRRHPHINGWQTARATPVCANDETAAAYDASLQRAANVGLKMAISHAIMESVDVTIAPRRLPRKGVGAMTKDLT